MKFLMKVAVGAGLLTGLGACGKDEGPVGGTGSIAISLSKEALTIQQGGSDNLTASITRSGGFTGTVNITTEGAPAGVTATVSNVSTSGTTTTGTVTVNVPASVAAGTYALTVKATGTGVSDVTKNVSLTVTAPPAISITLTGTPLTVQQGANGTVQVAINRTNFTGNVTLALEGAPTGVTGTFNPNPATANASTLTLAVAASAATGQSTLTVRATGTGVTAATATIALTVSAPTPGVSLTLTGTPLNVQQGANGTVQVAINRTSFTGDVTLALEGAPAGITGSFSPNPATANASTLTIQVGAGAAVGAVSGLLVRATGTGISDATAPVALTVTAPPASISLALSPTSLSVAKGNTGTTQVTITRTNFTGNVTLALDAATNVTASFNPSPTTGNTSTATINVASGAAVGAVNLTIRATGTGVDPATAQLALTVTEPGGGGNVSLDYSGCPVADRPVWLAYQDGPSGAWTRVTGTNGVYSFNISQSKGGLATVYTDNDGVDIAYFTQSEYIAFGGGNVCPPPPPAGKTVTGTVANLGGAGRIATVALGGSPASVVAPNTGFTLNNVPDGPRDLVAYAQDLAAAGTGDRMVITRDLNPAANTSIGTVDFTGGDSFAPQVATVNVSGAAGGETVTGIMAYSTRSSCDLGLLGIPGEVTGTSFPVYGVPSARQRSTDLHRLIVSSFTDDGASTRFIYESFLTLGNKTVALPTALPAPTVSTVTAPYQRLRFQYTNPAAYNFVTTLNYGLSSTKPVSISVTNGWLGGTTVDITMPDFTGVAGWDNAYAPASSAALEWAVAGAGGAGLVVDCTVGQFVAATRTNVLNVAPPVFRRAAR